MRELSLEEALKLEEGTEIVVEAFVGIYKGKEYAKIANGYILYNDGLRDYIEDLYGSHLDTKQYGVIYLPQGDDDNE